MFIPKHFFVPGIIEKRKPLSEHARRAGWVGCNILIENIPVQGRVAIVKDGSICDVQTVLAQVNQGKRLEVSDLHARGWLLDVLHCINSIPTTDFSLAEVYLFTDILSAKHPKNYNVQAKIRQQLQLLRDLGFVEFIARGKYRKV